MALTARLVWEGMLTELSKVNAPSLLLHEFNYYFNKAINQYINKRYNIYDVSQQTTDDLRVLKATAILTPNLATSYSDYQSFTTGAAKLFGATYEVVLPDDYLHMLNCVCIYKMAKTHKCYDKDDYVDFAAKRLTADSWSVIVNDYYNRPTPERPYYYIHNVNTETTVPTNPGVTDISTEYNVLPHTVYITKYRYRNSTDSEWTVIESNITLEDFNKFNYLEKEIIESHLESEKEYSERVKGSNFPRTIILGNPDKRIVSTVEKDTGTRYGNASKVRCEIRYGRDNSVYLLEKVFIDYIKAPQTIRLTKEQVDLTEDTSQIMEFPDYVCQEIINELVLLVMQRDADPRLQTLSAVTLSIANPAQQLAPQQTQPQRRG